MRLIIKINKLQVWEFEVGATDEFSIEFSQSDSIKARKAFEHEIAMFESFRKQYPGVKRGLETEFSNFTKKTKDWKIVLTMLLPSVMLEKDYKTKAKFRGEFVPEWPILSKWINNRYWEMEHGNAPTPTLGKTITFQSE